MNKKGQFFRDLHLSRLSASAVSVLMAAFMFVMGYTGWGIGFILLAILLAVIQNIREFR